MTTEMKTLQMDMEEILAKAKKSFDSVGAEVVTDEENNKQWRVGKYIFSHTIPTGRKYGKSSVIIEGTRRILLWILMVLTKLLCVSFTSYESQLLKRLVHLPKRRK